MTKAGNKSSTPLPWEQTECIPRASIQLHTCAESTASSTCLGRAGSAYQQESEQQVFLLYAMENCI